MMSSKTMTVSGWFITYYKVRLVSTFVKNLAGILPLGLGESKWSPLNVARELERGNTENSYNSFMTININTGYSSRFYVSHMFSGIY